MTPAEKQRSVASENLLEQVDELVMLARNLLYDGKRAESLEVALKAAQLLKLIRLLRTEQKGL
jgi:hypothetical protein